MTIAVLFDCGVWYYVKGLKIYDDDDEEEMIKVKTKVTDEQINDQLLSEISNNANNILDDDT